MAAAVADAVKAHQGRCGVKGKEIARAIGVSANTVADVLNGLRHGRWGETVIALDKWLEAELGRERNARPDDFVRTRVAETVFTVAEVASALKRIGLVYGWAGIGKTTALRAVAADKPGSVFVSVKTTSASPMGVLQAIAAGFSLRDVYNNNQRGLTDRLEQLLKGTPRLIIVDEIHKLCGTKDDKALHVLSDLYDATTGAPMLWSGTTDLVSYLDRQQAKGREPPAQIRSRICVARDLSDCGGGNGGDGGTPLYTVDEIRRVCGGGKMRLATDARRLPAQAGEPRGQRGAAHVPEPRDDHGEGERRPCRHAHGRDAARRAPTAGVAARLLGVAGEHEGRRGRPGREGRMNDRPEHPELAGLLPR